MMDRWLTPIHFIQVLGLGSNRDQLKHVENALIDVTHKVHHKPMIVVEIACDKISLITTI